MARATRATRDDARRRRGLTSSRDRWRDDRAQAEAKTGDDATATTTRGETKARGARREKSGANAGDEDVEIEYVAAPIELELEGTSDADGEDGLGEFKAIFEAFRARGARGGEVGTSADDAGAKKGDGGDGADEGDGDDGDDDGAGEELSNKKKKELRRMKVAELKQHCAKPEVVEVWDASANDPRLLVFLKAHRNTVPVPRHWSQKRAFLQGKRGIEKPPWELPDFIRATGIQKIRDHYAEKEDAKSLKQKAKDTKTAKLGRMDIDYQILHDAFFVYQSKPKMSKPGDLYFEGKEFEVSIGRKPGKLSEELKAALGMTDGGPPPWLINMQRYGPPPSYPHLRVPGLSAPIPAGAQFGYHPGGWGKPPVDELGVPIYGDVFGSTKTKASDSTPYDVAVDKTKRFGEIDEELEEEESEEEVEEEEVAAEEAEEEEAEEEEESAELHAGAETPDVLDLRKKSEGPKSLYTVLPSQEASVGADQIVGSAHTYVIPTDGDDKPKRRTRGAGVEVTLDAEALGDDGLQDEDAIRAAYEETVAAKKAAAAPEDFSDMVADHARAQKRKAKDKKDSDAKKFKF
jgi:splicing factor 3B subunit 2